MLGGYFGLNFSQADDSDFINMTFSQASSFDEVGASVTFNIPTFNHSGLNFPKFYILISLQAIIKMTLLVITLIVLYYGKRIISQLGNF